MRKVFMLLTCAMMMATFGSASAMTDRISTDLSENETAALSAAKEIVNNINEENGLYNKIAYRSCPYTSSEAKIGLKTVKIVPVFVNQSSDWKKMYQAEVEFNVDCPSVALP